MSFKIADAFIDINADLTKADARLREFSSKRYDVTLNVATAAIDAQLQETRTLLTRIAGTTTARVNINNAATAIAQLQKIQGLLEKVAGTTTARIRIDSTAATTQLRAIQGLLEKIAGTTTARVNIGPTTAATAQLQKIQGLLEKIAGTTTARVNINNAATAIAQLQKIQGLLEKIAGTTTARIRIDSTAATTQLRAIQGLLEKIAGTTTARVNADTAGAGVQLEAIREQLRRIGGVTTVRVNANTAGALGQVNALSSALSRTGSRAGIIGLIVGGVAAIAPAALAAVGVVAGLGAAIAGALGAVVVGLSGIGGAVKALGATTKASGNASAAAASQHKAMASAITGVRDAQEQLGDAQASAAASAARSARQIDDAQRGVAEAYQSAAEAAEGTAGRVADAERRMKDAVQSAAEAAVQSARRVVDAERQLEDAQKSARDAQEALTDARREAADQLADLQRRTEDMALSQEGAQISLLRAQEELTAVNADATASALDRREAALRVAEAEQRLQEVGEDSIRLAQEKAEADRAGIGGSDQVVAAQDRIRESAEQVGTAERAVQDARQEQARQAMDSAEQISTAERGLADARRDQGRQAVESAERVADAQRAVQDAVTAQAEQQRQSARSVADAQQAVVKAQEQVREASQQAGDQGSASANKLADAMAGLTPAGREFAIFLRGLIDGPLREFKAAGQENLLPGLQAGLEALVPMMPVITAAFASLSKTTGQALGGMIQILGALAVPFAEFADAALKGLAPLGPVMTKFATDFAAMTARVTADDTLKAAMAAIVEILRSLIGYLPTLIEWGLKLLIVIGPPLAKAFDALLPAIVELAKALGPLLAGALGTVTSMLTWMTKAMAEHPAAAQAIVAGLLAISAAAVTLRPLAAIFSVFAMLAEVNPVILAITAAIALLAGGFTMAYQRSEPFRNAIAGVWEHLQRAGQLIMSTVMPSLRTLWETIDKQVVPALAEFGTAIAPLISWLVDKLAPVVATTFGAIIKVIDGAMKVLTGILKVFTGILTGDWSKAWDGIKQILSGAWQAIKAVIEAALTNMRAAWSAGIEVLRADWARMWDNVRTAGAAAWNWVKTNVFDTFVNGLKVVGAAFTALWTLFVKPAFDSIRAGAQAVYAWVKANVFDNFVNGLKVVGAAFTALWTNYVKPAWDNIKSGVSTAWNYIRDNVFAKMSSGVAALGTAFANAQKAIGQAWDKVKEAARAPVAFVINSVMAPLANAWNSIISKVDSKLTFPVPRMATGGRVVGPGGDTSDDVPTMLSNNEWVIRAKAARQIGDRGMAAINNADRLGLEVSGDPSFTTIRPKGYADGGKVGAVQSFIRSTDPLPYVWGGVGPNGYDCSGLVGEVWARLTGHPSYRRHFTTLNAVGVGGFKSGHGAFTIGLSPSHVVGNLGGLAFEAASTKSGIKVGGSAKSVDSMPSQYYLPQTGDGFVGGGGGSSTGGDGGSSFSPLELAKQAAKAAIGKLTDGWWSGLGGMGFFGDAMVGVGKKLVTSVFDDGGMIQPGTSLVSNRSGRPEPVFSAQQWDTLRGLIPAQRDGATAQAGATYHFEPGSITLDASKVQDLADMVRMIESLTTTARAYGSVR